jgi:hypothetical protein
MRVESQDSLLEPTSHTIADRCAFLAEKRGKTVIDEVPRLRASQLVRVASSVAQAQPEVVARDASVHRDADLDVDMLEIASVHEWVAPVPARMDLQGQSRVARHVP